MVGCSTHKLDRSCASCLELMSQNITLLRCCRQECHSFWLGWVDPGGAHQHILQERQHLVKYKSSYEENRPSYCKLNENVNFL